MSEELTYWQWKNSYYESERFFHERLGQAFMNDYMQKMTWSELFYEEKDHKCEELILNFLDNNSYDPDGPLPQSYR